MNRAGSRWNEIRVIMLIRSSGKGMVPFEPREYLQYNSGQIQNAYGKANVNFEKVLDRFSLRPIFRKVE